MKKVFKNALGVLAVSGTLLLASCGGGSSGSSPTPPPSAACASNTASLGDLTVACTNDASCQLIKLGFNLPTGNSVTSVKATVSDSTSGTVIGTDTVTGLKGATSGLTTFTFPVSLGVGTDAYTVQFATTDSASNTCTSSNLVIRAAVAS